MIELTVDHGDGDYEPVLFNLINIVLILSPRGHRRTKVLIQYKANGNLTEWALKESYEEVKQKLGIK